MLKAVGTKDGKPLYVFGISQGNWELLKRGRPILIDLDVLTATMPRDQSGLRGSMLLFGADSERGLEREAAKFMAIGPETEVRFEKS